MSFSLTIPQSSEDPLDISVKAGEILFVLGANGTGKSGLMHHFYRLHSQNARRITAHRQTWFSSSGIDLTPEQKRSTESHLQSVDTNPQARWADQNPGQRASIAIYDLVDSENVSAREIANAVRKKDLDHALKLGEEDAPIEVINELLRLSNIPIAISILANDRVLASKSGGEPYNIEELSDGERNALLLAANVLTVKAGALLLIDEPERHLHRSIISPLLGQLFGKRPDCAFVVSTHEVMLPIDHPEARVLLVRGSVCSKSKFTAWDVDLVASGGDIDDDLMKDILGARRKLLFIEGEEHSLDKLLYSLIFPGVSILPKSSCREVEHAVSGIRGADTFHWLHAFGIVDNDRRPQVDIDRMRANGVYALSVFSVESVYYHPDVQRRAVERHSEVTGDSAAELLSEAAAEALKAIKPCVKHLSERAVERAIRHKVLQKTPRRKDIVKTAPIDIHIDVASVVAVERDRLQRAIDEGALTDIVAHYPIRETPALDCIAKTLRFKDRIQYESTVRKVLMDDEETLTFVKSLFGTLAADIEAA